ncbi:PREDICTED: pre-rRNA-processing protein las1 [Tarenaya hassleriana]|uniref:pre-rRNA-processing protein las1 n=1 Tax=Tarenaya hassleriana TaxID=28532 RepID=UPI00053C8146|nr:PREDICTED: pre-rRNA-processing protein las1 [Tarenaya hassleriana]
MDPLAGIEAELFSFFEDQDPQQTSSDGCKPVPWLSWDEWDSVRESLFSASSDRVASALERVMTWRSRGSLPAPVDVTASIIEIRQKDGFVTREKQPADALYSENLLQMLYCMGILRLVNCVIEKTRRRTEVSIAEAAKAINIPRKLIDLRHEGSHRELPALSVLRDASDEALEWLKSYYWEPQKNQIPFKKDDAANIRREIKSKLRKLSLCLQLRQNPQVDSALVKEKCSKKKIRKILTGLVELYSSFPSEIVSVLLEFLLKALNSSKSAEILNQNEPDQDFSCFLDEWKPVIMEFSNREPELLLNLLKSTLDMIQNGEKKSYETEWGLESKSTEDVSKVEKLPVLLAWLVGHLRGLRHFQKNSTSEGKTPNMFLTELVRKCLLLSACGHDQLANSALQLAELVGGRVWKEKLIKLAYVHKPRMDVPLERCSSLVTTHETLFQQERSIHSAAKKLEFVKIQLSKKKSECTEETDARVPKTWVKPKTWNPCPIGMLPRVIGSSGRLPLLNCREATEKTQTKSMVAGQSDSTKREAEIQLLDDSTTKRARKTMEDPESNREGEMDARSESKEKAMFNDEDNLLIEESGSCLMIGGEWKVVNTKELLEIASAVRILV